MLRKLAAYPRQNGLALALRELGRLERTLFVLSWLQSLELRRRIHVGLNKGEAKSVVARAVFFNRQGELRDRTYENQRHRASGRTRSVHPPRKRGQTISDELLRHLSPLGWEHINLTGDYVWKGSDRNRQPQLRLVRGLRKRP